MGARQRAPRVPVVKRVLGSFTEEEYEFIELVSVGTDIAAWRLLGCVIEKSYGVLSGEEQQRLEGWLESLAVNRSARQIFDKVMAEGMYISQVKKERPT